MTCLVYYNKECIGACKWHDYRVEERMWLLKTMYLASNPRYRFCRIEMSVLDNNLSHIDVNKVPDNGIIHLHVVIPRHLVRISYYTTNHLESQPCDWDLIPNDIHCPIHRTIKGDVDKEGAIDFWNCIKNNMPLKYKDKEHIGIAFKYISLFTTHENKYNRVLSKTGIDTLKDSVKDAYQHISENIDHDIYLIRVQIVITV